MDQDDVTRRLSKHGASGLVAGEENKGRDGRRKAGRGERHRRSPARQTIKCGAQPVPQVGTAGPKESHVDCSLNSFFQKTVSFFTERSNPHCLFLLVSLLINMSLCSLYYVWAVSCQR